MTDSQRLKTLLEYLKLSVAGLAKEIGYKRAQKIYNVSYGLNGISAELARDITEKYREISFEWLKDGKGQMLLNSQHAFIPEQTSEVKRFHEYDAITLPAGVLLGYKRTIERLENEVDTLKVELKKMHSPNKDGGSNVMITM